MIILALAMMDALKINDGPQIYDWEKRLYESAEKNEAETIEIHPVKYWHEN